MRRGQVIAITLYVTTIPIATARANLSQIIEDVNIPWLEASGGDHIDLCAKEVRKLVVDPAEIKQARARLHVQEEIHIGLVSISGSRDRPKDLEVGCLVSACDPHDLLLLSLDEIPESARTVRLSIRLVTTPSTARDPVAGG